MSTARLFFALWPDEAVRRQLHKSCRDAVKACGGRPVPARNYHLTLAFLGNVAIELLPAIRAAAAELPPPSLELRLDRFGSFPRARVAWIGPGEPAPELAGLSQSLWAAMIPLGLDPDVRPFRPHVTIARNIQREASGEIRREVIWPVRRFALIRSVTATEGARYTVDQGFPGGSSNEP